MIPLIKLAKLISPEKYNYLLRGAFCFILWGSFHWLGLRLRKRSKQKTTEITAFQNPNLRWGTTSLTMGYIAASIGWQLFNYTYYPLEVLSQYGQSVVIPIFSIAAVVFFLTIAYWLKDQISLLFGIGFIGHVAGMISCYWTGCYALAISMPLVEMFIGLLLLLIGMQHSKVSYDDEDWRFSFSRTYQWTGLLFAFLSLWIMSIWGITYKGSYWSSPGGAELWLANILFIGASLGAISYGAAKNDRLYFNFGLTFFIIESYTVFFSHAWDNLGTAFGSLLLGILLVVTGYILRALWIKGYLFRKNNTSTKYFDE